MKIYAKQINPEYQESPFFMFDPAEIYPGIIFDGNRHFNSHTTAKYDHLIRYLDTMAGYWEDANFWYEWDYTARKSIAHKKTKPDCTLSELLHGYGFSREDKKEWTTKQRHKWRLIFESDDPTSDENICQALELITGKEHDTATIRGCCQSDWQEIIYPVTEYSRECIETLEADYFNTGTEWIVHDEENDPEEPGEISGYSIYCYGWNNEQIRAEIAAAANAAPEDVVLYEYAGSYSIPKYNLVGA